jgi:hypothetical protein
MNSIGVYVNQTAYHVEQDRDTWQECVAAMQMNGGVHEESSRSGAVKLIPGEQA